VALLILAAACSRDGYYDHVATPGSTPSLDLAPPSWLADSAVPAESPHTATGRPPHVLLISLDTLRADHLGAWGYERPTSPFLDALAGSGVRFARAFSQSPKTAPSHMSVFTGTFPLDHGAHFDYATAPPTVHPVRDEIPTLPEHMLRAGYRTAAWTGGGQVSFSAGFARGFKEFNSGLGKLDPQKMETIRRWFREHADRPCFLFLHTYQIHDPYLPPPPYDALFADPAYDGWVVADRERLTSGNDRSWDTLHAAFWRKTGSAVDTSLIGPADLQRLVDLYDGGIRFTDDVLRGFFAGLHADGLLTDTLVVVFSDHGEEFLEHGGVLHEMLYRETLHVPLIFYGPSRLPRGAVVEAQVPLFDLGPTLLELAGVDPSPVAQARSLLPLLEFPAQQPDRTVYSEEPWSHLEGFHRSLRTGEHTVYDHDRGRVELFDARSDPLEQQDLAADRPDLLSSLLATASALVEHRNAGRTPPTTSAQELSPEDIEALRALGYLE
jgi:arylsulfatase A-like enzyme